MFTHCLPSWPEEKQGDWFLPDLLRQKKQELNKNFGLAIFEVIKAKARIWVLFFEVQINFLS